jgi:hypothetical protein
MAANPKVLAIDSTWDDNTASATGYRVSNVYGYLTQKGYPVNELSGSNANKQEAEQAAKAGGITYITGVSHGDSDKFTGDQDNPVFETGSYDPAAVEGKIIHFLSCNTALFLGRSLIDPGGALAFFGYDGPFAWPDVGGAQYADIFFECDAQIDKALADGKSASEAALQSIVEFNKQIEILKNRGDDTSLKAAAMLEKDRDMLKSPYHGDEYGDPNATLT